MSTQTENQKKQASILQTVVIDDNRFAVEEKDGDICFNLTMMGKRYGKSFKPAYWLRTEEAERYINRIACVQKCDTADLVHVRQGGTPELQGTWAYDHRIAVRYAQWLDMDFAIAIDGMVIKMLTGQAVEKPFMGVAPLIVEGKPYYNYTEILRAAGFSTKSGSVRRRRIKYESCFIKKYGRNFITLDFCKLLQSLGSYRQMQLELFDNQKNLGHERKD